MVRCSVCTTLDFTSRRDALWFELSMPTRHWKRAMAQTKTRVRKNKSEIRQTQRKAADVRETTRRRRQAVPTVNVNVKAQRVKAASKPKRDVSAGANRSEGIRLFALAGRPTRDQFTRVYGPAGPKMTWQQRAAAGVPAEKFQAALASAGQGKK